MLTEDQIILKTTEFVKLSLQNTESGHDWWHIYRVWQLSKEIAKTEECNLYVVEMAALLHDIADSKFYNGNEEIGPQTATAFLQSMGIDDNSLFQIVQIIKNISFGGGNQMVSYTSQELSIVQDADRLDAMGAIGIARTFNYGGFKNRAIYDPAIQPNLKMTKEEYKKSTAPTLNHFYQKLLQLKNRMNTKTGQQMAQKRHEFMEFYLEQFFKEWEGIL